MAGKPEKGEAVQALRGGTSKWKSYHFSWLISQ